MDDQPLDFLIHGGAAAPAVRRHDWSITPLGDPVTWPASLRAIVATIFASPIPQIILWGPSHISLYNDAFASLLTDNPDPMGLRFDTAWAQYRDVFAPIFLAAERGESGSVENVYLTAAATDPDAEQPCFTFHCSPLQDAEGAVAGLLGSFIETTQTADAQLQRRRLAFLDKLAQAIQPETEPGAILAITTRLTVKHLSLSNCAYADMDADQDGFTIRGDWPAGGNHSIMGHYSLADFGAQTVDRLTAGRTLILNDISADLPPEDAAMFRSLGIAAMICIPLVKDGGLTALMAIHDSRPRQWSDYDLSIIEEVTERSWAHVERARSEANLRRAQEAGGVGLFTVELDRNLIHGTEQFCKMFGLPVCSHIAAEEIEALVVPEDRHIVSSQMRRASGEAPVDVEYRIRRPDTGKIRVIARKADYERDASGTPVRMVGAVRDVTEQRAAQQSVLQSEAEFRMLAEAMPNMAWTANAAGRLDWCNEWVYSYSGLAPGALNRKAWARLVHPDDLEDTKARWVSALSSGVTYQAEFRLRRGDGLYRWHLARAVPVRKATGEIYRWIGTNTDIDDRVNAEAKTARDRERLWAMSQDLLLVCDTDGIITDINPTAMRRLGWDRSEMIGRATFDFIHPQDHATARREMARIAAGSPSLTFENRYLTKAGDYIVLDWTAVADGDRIHGIGRDITENRAIMREQERIWTLSPVLKIVAAPDGRLSKVNPAWTANLGWSAGQSNGRMLASFVEEPERETAMGALGKLTTGRQSRDLEWTLTTSDGGQRQISWSFVAENDCIYGFGRDISEQRMAEDALRQSQKMEAVGQLTGGIAHDFNNLLQGISGNLELLQHRSDQGRLDGIDRFIKSAATSTARAAALTHRLLAFSRRQPLDPRPVRANPLIASMEDMLRRALGESISLDLVLADSLWLTKCDPNQLESAILNLAINARDAMPAGGTLTIETCNTHLDAGYVASQRDVAAGQYVCICVSDTGVGMDPQTMSRAFEPFFTTKPIGQGTGLGLSMIYGFIRQSEGHAKLYSEPEKGTTVKLYLPRQRQETVEKEAESPQLTADHRADAAQTVLVVEDEPVVRGLIVEVLAELGYRVIEAVDGPSGLQVLQSNRHIDLLITDIGLPGLNGRQVADAGRISRPDLKILFMTGYAENAALASGFLEPGMAMITKPFAMEALASRIRDMIAS